MRRLVVACLLGVVGCSDARDGDLQDGDVASMEVMALALEDAPAAGPDGSASYTDEREFDCPSGGKVLVKVQWSVRDSILHTRRYYVTWDYSACAIWPHGTIDGDVRYSISNEELPDRWKTTVNYFADLVYDGGSVHDCDAYMTLTRHTPGRTPDLEIRNHCPHPVLYWWALWGIG